MKIILFLILLCTSVACLAEWDEDTSSFAIELNAIDLSSKSALNSSLKSTQLSIGRTFLNEGWGTKVLHKSTLSTIDNISNENIYSNIWSLSNRLFLNESTNLDFGFSTSRSLMDEGLYRTRNLTGNAIYYIADSKEVFGRLDLAKDRSYLSVFTTFNYNDSAAKLLSGLRFQDIERLSSNTQLAWQITEDSFFTSKLEYGKTNQKIFERKTEVFNSYLGFKTKYFGASSLSVFVGNSSSPDSRDIFSWQLQHNTQLNEYSLITVSSKHTLTDTDDTRFAISETTQNSLQVALRYSENWRYSVSMVHLNQQVANNVDLKRELLEQSFQLNVIEDWLFAVTHQFEDYSDDRFAFEQNTVEFKIKRDFV